MSLSLVAIVTRWADSIHNGRTLRSIAKSIRLELAELEEEIAIAEHNDVLRNLGGNLVEHGKDGVFGEAVDIIASALDMIRQVRPNATVEELEAEVAEYLNQKCHKWATKYGDHDQPYVPLETLKC